MAPPVYADLGKTSRDVFGKGYHFGVLKLNCKTKTSTGVEFTSGGSSNLDSGKVLGNLETKYKIPEYGELNKALSPVYTLAGSVIIYFVSFRRLDFHREMEHWQHFGNWSYHPGPDCQRTESYIWLHIRPSDWVISLTTIDSLVRFQNWTNWNFTARKLESSRLNSNMILLQSMLMLTWTLDLPSMDLLSVDTRDGWLVTKCHSILPSPSWPRTTSQLPTSPKTLLSTPMCKSFSSYFLS